MLFLHYLSFIIAHNYIRTWRFCYSLLKFGIWTRVVFNALTDYWNRIFAMTSGHWLNGQGLFLWFNSADSGLKNQKEKATKRSYQLFTILSLQWKINGIILSHFQRNENIYWPTVFFCRHKIYLNRHTHKHWVI